MEKIRALMLVILLCGAGSAIAIAGSQPPSLTNGVAAKYGKLPLSFEPNRGQTDSQVQFLARGQGYTLFLSASEAVFFFRSGRSSDSSAARPSSFAPNNNPAQFSALRLRLLGASAKAGAEGLALLSGRSNYFIGKDQSRWRTNVPQFGRVRYRDVYPGIDLVYYGNQGRLEHDFVVATGASPQAISLGIDGAEKSDISSQGDLVLHLPDGDVCLQKPIAYQQFGKVKREVAVHYVLRGNKLSFDVGAYNSKLPLVIDPVLLYSTYLGGSKFDSAFGIAVDSTGHAYVTGQTSSSNFPKTTSRVFAGVDDVFVAKLNAAGTGLLYSTYLGGSGNDKGSAIGVDGFGNAYVTGTTSSLNFPTTPGVFQPNCNIGEATLGCADTFVAKLSTTGLLLYSTFLGGDNFDATSGIGVDPVGNAYVTGWTSSTNFPVTAGAFQAKCKTATNNCFTAFLTKLNSSASKLLYSTYLGGSGPADKANAISVDGMGNAYVTGVTSSIDFPTTAGAFQVANRGVAGNSNGFVTKVNPTGSALVYSTYLGGSGNFDPSFGDMATAITIDKFGNAYVAGQTYSTDFPVTPGAYQTICGAGNQSRIQCVAGFATKFNSTGSSLLFSTYLESDYQENGIAVDQSGITYVIGWDPIVPTVAGVTALNRSGTGLIYRKLLDGNGDNFPNGVVVDAAGNTYVAGQTSSSNFPVTAGAFQTAYHGGIDAFVSKIVVAAGLAISVSASSNPVAHGSNLTYSIGVFNKGPDGSDGDVLTDTIPAGTTFVSFANTNGTCTAPAVGATGTLTCKRSNRLLAGHWWGPVTLTVKVQAASGSTITNTTHVKSSTQDLVSGNNAVTVKVSVN